MQPSIVFAQNAVFSGTVTNEEGRPLENVHVLLNQGEYFDISNQSGQFTIENIEPGRYLLTVNILGYQPYSKLINIGETGLNNLTVRLDAESYQLDEIVVTATRTRKMLEDIPLPVTVVPKDRIKKTGSMRLSDVLSEVTGLRLVTSRRQTGLQVQGFSSEYTLIMINGQPLIGRRAGILDLDRISVENVKRIEIIKGPSSALWGSSALAGVVNLITETSKQPFSLDVNSRYGTNQTLDLGATLSWQTDKWWNTFHANRLRSSGYRLVPGSISKTVPEYQNYTLSYRTNYSLSNRIDLGFYGRFYQGDKNNDNFVGDEQSPTLLNVNEMTRNYGLTPSLSIDINEKLNLDISHFISGYYNERSLTYKKDGDRYEHNIFDQIYNKTDLKATQTWNNDNTTVLGLGMYRENLNSDRYSSYNTLRNLFVYGQHDWNITDQLNIIAGFRFDDHNVYGSQFSPKFSVQYKAADWLHLRASTGRG
ncbi:MAG TPA: TonB-dependent receptor, partial [Balneolaceae bacterium]|nr:TonB-dependent receptor [Balneolaceae bacterium]